MLAKYIRLLSPSSFKLPEDWVRIEWVVEEARFNDAYRVDWVTEALAARNIKIKIRIIYVDPIQK